MSKIGFIGVGNMASSLVRAVYKSDPSAKIYLNTLEMDKIQDLAQEVHAELVYDQDRKEGLIDIADYIYIGVKPNQQKDLFKDLSPYLSDDSPKTWITMAAGVSVSEFSQYIPKTHSIIRIMPNTPVAIGEGYIAYTTSDNISQDKLNGFINQLKAGGVLVNLSEDKFASVTGLAGSGPAFIYLLIEAMSDAGVLMGLGRDEAIQMAAQTVRGASSMVIETGQHPAQLKDQVTSPAGTTITGVKALEDNAFRASIMEAVQKATQKAQAMED